MALERMTAKQAENAKPGVRGDGQQIPKMYNDGKGLLLRVGANGSKSWVYRYRVDGKVHDIGLGSYDARGAGGYTLAEARSRADVQRKLRRDGGDPLQNTKRAKVAATLDALTFRQVGDKYVEAKEAEWSAKHRSDVIASLTNHAYPTIGDMPVGDVDTKAIMRTIQPKWLTLTETMSRTRSRIEAVLGYAVTAGYRAPGDNPARWEKHLENLLPRKAKVAKPENMAALEWQDIPDFMVDLRAKDGLVARATEFTI
jgi:hypothetical protein